MIVFVKLVKPDQNSLVNWFHLIDVEWPTINIFIVYCQWKSRHIDPLNLKIYKYTTQVVKVDKERKKNQKENEQYQ